MRPALVLLVNVAILGGLTLYLQQRTSTARPIVAPVETAVKGEFHLEVTPTFAAEPDPFSLDLDKGSEAAALLVRFRGQEVLRKQERLEAGVPLRSARVTGLVSGRNEFFVEIHPPLSQAGLAQAVRVRLLRDHEPLLEHTLWTDTPTRTVTWTLSADQLQPAAEGTKHAP